MPEIEVRKDETLSLESLSSLSNMEEIQQDAIKEENKEHHVDTDSE